MTIRGATLSSITIGDAFSADFVNDFRQLIKAFNQALKQRGLHLALEHFQRVQLNDFDKVKRRLRRRADFDNIEGAYRVEVAASLVIGRLHPVAKRGAVGDVFSRILWTIMCIWAAF